MNDQIKFIVEKLNKEPFKRSLSFIQFDALNGNGLLQLLNTIFTEIDSKNKVDIRDEQPEQTTIRMLNFLKVLKYKPNDETNVNAFRQGLVLGEKSVVIPIMKWCLERMPELKKRAYLARFLIKIDVPSEFMIDSQMVDLYAQYEEIIDKFKETHRNYDNLVSTQHTTEDIRKDIVNMEEEKEQIAKRLERVKKKVDVVNNSSSLLEASRSYRMEVQREEKIRQQKYELRNHNAQLEQKLDRLESTLKEQQNSLHDLNPEAIIQKLEEENKVNTYLVNQKYPKEMSMYKQKIKDYESILAKSTLTQNDIIEIKRKAEDVQRDVQALIEKRDANRDPIDDKLTMFRQQATLIARKKDKYVEELRELRHGYNELEHNLKEKRRAHGLDEDVPRGEEFKRYVNKLRSKSTLYKKMKQEIAQLQSELNVLKRTEEILRKKYDSVKSQLTSEERSEVESGFNNNRKGHTHANVDRVEEAMSQKELKAKINAKKAELAPYVQELKALRDQCDQLSGEYEAKKAKYDQKNAEYESNRSSLEQDVKALATEFRIAEERFHKLNCQKLISLGFQKRAQDELKLYTSKNISDKSFRDQLTKRINEQESIGKTLKDKQKSTKDVSVDGTKQMKLWRDILRQMELKRKLYLNEYDQQQQAIDT